MNAKIKHIIACNVGKVMIIIATLIAVAAVKIVQAVGRALQVDRHIEEIGVVEFVLISGVVLLGCAFFFGVGAILGKIGEKILQVLGKGSGQNSQKGSTNDKANNL